MGGATVKVDASNGFVALGAVVAITVLADVVVAVLDWFSRRGDKARRRRGGRRFK